MSWLPLSFGAPALLAGLVALPVIWWLLRLTPPRPQTEVFPPLKILARLRKHEETPHQSPWWLTLLRMLMAAIVILALTNPVYNPRESAALEGGALALVIDNGWASAPDWDARIETANDLVGEARNADLPVYVSLTAEAENADVGPFTPTQAVERLNAAEPRPIPVDRPAAFERLTSALAQEASVNLAIIADDLAATDDEAAFSQLFSLDPARVIWASAGNSNPVGLINATNAASGFSVEAIRLGSAPRTVTLIASDTQGRPIAETQLSFGVGEERASASFDVPFELRNEFAQIAVEGANQAAAVRLQDENAQRRRVGLLSQTPNDAGQPLLSPLYYLREAMAPFADLIEPQNPDLNRAVPQLIERDPSIIIMADIGALPESAHAALSDWVEKGGMLVQFAGPRLAAADTDTDLLPVRLRRGERSLGGTLSWTEPQALAEFAPDSPFSSLAVSNEVTVTRQVLAEPTPDLSARSWARLADGTPLITGAKRGQGTLVLFHTTADARWSNLPISGTFVEMLQRLTQIARRSTGADASPASGTLAPYRLVSADGQLTAPGPDARPLAVGDGAVPVTRENPPGFYGTADGYVAHNLLDTSSRFARLNVPQAASSAERIQLGTERAMDLRPYLFAAALLLLALDTLIVLWLGGLRHRFARPVKTASILLLAGIAYGASGSEHSLAQAQPAHPVQEIDGATAIEAVTKTRLAYVRTGNAELDNTSRAGLYGLSRYLTAKTALEPGNPQEVDIATDELAFYPLLYWPIDPDADMPSDAAIARIDAYMKQGGSVLFDTRDQYSAGFDSNAVSPATQRLRDILANLSVPPLEPVPDDHVLTKAFYILRSFPGRYDGGPLWVEASVPQSQSSTRPVNTGDGVSPIMITANDFAGAWAMDESGQPLFPTVPADPMQRVYAYRVGINIVMYMLTGNYKSDQVHVPALLERLGQ
ncbi:DUF4159 domain-containing protein [Limoniibacter endophyticus]|nr:DUF4159 domain-containing protein [Limoniibacter endophyticus]